MDVRIGVTQAPRELNMDIDDDGRDDVIARVDAALSGDVDVLSLTDRKGRTVSVPSAKIADVEVGSAEGGRRIGLGG